MDARRWKTVTSCKETLKSIYIITAEPSLAAWQRRRQQRRTASCRSPQTMNNARQSIYREKVALPSGLSLELSLSPPNSLCDDGNKLAVLLHPWSRLGGNMNDPYVVDNCEINNPLMVTLSVFCGSFTMFCKDEGSMSSRTTAVVSENPQAGRHSLVFRKAKTCKNWCSGLCSISLMFATSLLL